MSCEIILRRGSTSDVPELHKIVRCTFGKRRRGQRQVSSLKEERTLLHAYVSYSPTIEALEIVWKLCKGACSIVVLCLRTTIAVDASPSAPSSSKISRISSNHLLSQDTSAKMAAAHVTTRSILSSFLPRLFTSSIAPTSRQLLSSRQITHPLLPSLAFSTPAISLNVPGILEGLWESVLRAVPKKKTSHMKKRHRQMAGKALKDVGVNRCSACGHAKRAHVLCPYCVSGV